MSQLPTKKQRRESDALEKRFSLDFWSEDDALDAFFEPPKRTKLKVSKKGLDLVEDKNKKLRREMAKRNMFPLPVSSITEDIVDMSRQQVVPSKGAKTGLFIEAKGNKLARSKKTRIT